MPELPEIESIRLKLAEKIINAEVLRIVLKRKDLRYPMPEDINTRLASHSIIAVRRRSKYLLFDFDNGQTLVLHLGMSGRIFFAAPNLPLDKHDHVLIEMKDGRWLRFRDPRRFGMLFLCETEHLTENKFFRHLGVEPLDEAFNATHLHALCKKSRTTIKALLMNAKNVVGVGNIYANESLFQAGIKPTRRSHTLTRREAELLCTSIKSVLNKSIAAGGTTFRDYVNADAKPGLYQLELFVYDREGLPCQKCKTKIKRITQVGRSSFYCAKCQR